MEEKEINYNDLLIFDGSVILDGTCRFIESSQAPKEGEEARHGVTASVFRTHQKRQQ